MKSWLIYIAIAAGVYIFGNSFTADRNADGVIVSEGSIDVFNVHVGDCFNDSDGSGDGFEEYSSLAGVPCAEPHDNEVYAVFDVSISDYPGEQDMYEQALQACLKRFDRFVGKDYQSSSLDVMPLYPTSTSWGQGDREVICAVYDMNLAKLEGSVEGRAL